MVNVSVVVRNGRFDKALRAFKDAMWRGKIVERYIAAQSYEKPSVVRRRKKLRSIHRSQLRNKAYNF